jgi:hypothetical protein
MENGNTRNTSIKYVSVENIPNSTHGNSAVSLPKNPKNRKLHVKNQKNLLLSVSNTFGIPMPQSIIGNK